MSEEEFEVAGPNDHAIEHPGNLHGITYFALPVLVSSSYSDNPFFLM
jgi:hypothetical protein